MPRMEDDILATILKAAAYAPEDDRLNEEHLTKLADALEINPQAVIDVHEIFLKANKREPMPIAFSDN